MSKAVQLQFTDSIKINSHLNSGLFSFLYFFPSFMIAFLRDEKLQQFIFKTKKKERRKKERKKNSIKSSVFPKYKWHLDQFHSKFLFRDCMFPLKTSLKNKKRKKRGQEKNRQKKTILSTRGKLMRKYLTNKIFMAFNALLSTGTFHFLFPAMAWED